MSKVTLSLVESPVMVKLVPVATRSRVSLLVSATGLVPEVVVIVPKLLPAPLSELQAQTSVVSFHLRI